jgi:hypothetical protein
MSARTSGRVSFRISLQPSRPWKPPSSGRSQPCSMVPIAPLAITTLRLTAYRSAWVRTGWATASISRAERGIWAGYERHCETLLRVSVCYVRGRGLRMELLAQPPIGLVENRAKQPFQQSIHWLSYRSKKLGIRQSTLRACLQLFRPSA